MDRRKELSGSGIRTPAIKAARAFQQEVEPIVQVETDDDIVQIISGAGDLLSRAMAREWALA